MGITLVLVGTIIAVVGLRVWQQQGKGGFYY